MSTILSELPIGSNQRLQLLLLRHWTEWYLSRNNDIPVDIRDIRVVSTTK